MPKALSAEQYYHIQQALEMEKQQIIDAYDKGQENPQIEVTNYFEPNTQFNETPF